MGDEAAARDAGSAASGSTVGRTVSAWSDRVEGDAMADWVVGLAAALRGAGIEVSTGQVVACRQALTEVDPTDPTDRFLTGRTCLVSDPRHLDVYRQVFLRYDRGDPPAVPVVPPPPEPVTIERASDADEPYGAGDQPPAVAGAIASQRERLRHRRFDHICDDERAEIAALLDRLHVAVPRRASRRRRAGRRGELDLARTLERSLEVDGELLDPVWRARQTRPRRLVLLLDVSGSMAPHARWLLRLAVAARRTADREAGRRVEVFAFGTRLTRLSDALAQRDPDAAIAAAADRVVDWDGGTRIGASIDELLRTWARRGTLRGAVVVICSDGLERGDPALLGRSMARLRRHVHRIVWVNPLAGDERYEPRQRGMAAAAPYLDALVPGDTVAALERLTNVLAELR